MMMKLHIVMVFLGLLFFPLFADSPITSTDFYKVYQDHELVNRARETRQLDAEMCRFISNRYETVDIKIAIINALSWEATGDNNTRVFRAYLGQKYGSEYSWPGRLLGDEWLCFGYLMAMDDYFNPSPAIPYLEKALDGLPNSYSAHIIHAVVVGQSVMEKDWCLVWQTAEAVEKNASLNMDLRAEAKEIIIDYLRIYGDYCDRPAQVQTTTYNDPCEGAYTQAELNDCHEKKYGRADNRLNEAYETIMQNVGVETARQLRQSQRDWIQFRDSNCIARSENYRGGSIYPMVHLQCMIELTENRIKELLAFYDQVSNSR